MADEVKVWEVTGNGALKKVQPAKLSLEARIEEWIKQDISVLVPDGSKLLQIGQQVSTDLGDEIDLLCMKTGDKNRGQTGTKTGDRRKNRGQTGRSPTPKLKLTHP